MQKQEMQENYFWTCFAEYKAVETLIQAYGQGKLEIIPIIAAPMAKLNFILGSNRELKCVDSPLFGAKAYELRPLFDCQLSKYARPYILWVLP